MAARRLPSSVWVTGLTVGALAVVVVLAVKAEQGPQPHATAAAKPSASASREALRQAQPGCRGGRSGRVRDRAAGRLLARAGAGLAR